MKRITHITVLCLAAAMANIGQAQAAGPTDPQIAHIVVTDAGKLAETKAASQPVKDFAKQMVTDHTAVNKAATNLAAKLNVEPEDNATSQSLKKGGEENLQNLKTLHGAAFDRAYIDHEVAYHQAVIQAVDNTLIPNAHNAELKALLEKSGPTFAAHHEHAKQLQASLPAGK